MTPQQNGKSEVFNRIIVDKVRTMLLESGLPKTLWAEALMCAVYTKNRSPTKGNPDFKSPFEMLFGKLPSFSRLKCFGTIAFRLDKSVSKRKLDPKSKPYVFVGCKSEVFNRIIVDKVRTMLLESGLPKTLWAEALMCAVYTKNRSPTKGNPDFKSPFEMLFGKLPSFSRLKYFGTIAFGLDKSVSKRKLDPKSKPYVFVIVC